MGTRCSPCSLCVMQKAEGWPLQQIQSRLQQQTAIYQLRRTGAAWAALLVAAAAVSSRLDAAIRSLGMQPRCKAAKKGQAAAAISAKTTSADNCDMYQL